MATTIGFSFSRLASSPFHFQRRRTAIAQLSLSQFLNQQSGAQLTIYGKDKSYQFMNGMPKLRGRLQKQQTTLFVVPEDQFGDSEPEKAALPENHDSNPENISLDGNSSFHLSGGDGKPGIVSFYNRPYRRGSKVILSNLERSQNSILWFMGPAVLVTSVIFPSLCLRRVLSVIFEDSLLTEAIFYCGVAVFLFLLDRLRRDTVANNSYTLTPQLEPPILSIATLLLNLTIPMVTMSWVWPWTCLEASTALAPFLVGILVQFTFEQYAKYWKSPSRAIIPFIFQVYRLHQLYRAGQLVTALSSTIKGAGMTSHDLAINSSLGTLLNVLQILVGICIWSIASFLMRFLPSGPTTMQ
ncbi:hypothetical protein SESBI_02863 [Sesbania bispinosa]|nr:hypothetical protein SESBI_02863 [Sesbania bispinosa]